MGYKHSLINTDSGILVLPRVEDLTLANLGVPDVRAETIGALYPLGTALITDDGVYRYSRCGAAAVTLGKLLQQAAVGNSTWIKDVAVATTTAIGDTSVTITTPTGDLTLDQLKDGYLFVNAGSGSAGAVYKIKSHPAATAAASCVITLVDPLETILTAGTSKLGLRKNLYDGVIVAPTLPTGIPVGVVNHSSFTAVYYAWIKTKGIVPVLTNSTVVVGEPVIHGNTTAGSVDAYNLAGASMCVIVGTVISVAATTEYSLVKIDLDPSW